jgi:hypothetical protein
MTESPARCAGQRTGICPVTLAEADHLRAHDACHSAAGLRNQTMGWVRSRWQVRLSPGKYDIQSLLTALPGAERPLHALTTEIVAHDLQEATATSSTNRRGWP